MADAHPRSPDPGRRPRRALRWWLSAATFVVGLFVGAVLVGLAAGGSITLPARGTATGSAAAPSAAAPSSGSTEIVVNDACLKALQAAQDVYGTVDQLRQAVSRFNASRLDELVRQLGALQSRLRDDIGSCNVATRLPNGSTVPGTPPASPTA